MQKSFGVFLVFVYNKNMKRFVRILGIIVLMLPMVFGAMFLSPNLAHNTTLTTQNGGNLLNSQETDGNSDFEGNDEDPKNDFS